MPKGKIFGIFSLINNSLWLNNTLGRSDGKFIDHLAS